jgi:hypothetical protein
MFFFDVSIQQKYEVKKKILRSFMYFMIAYDFFSDQKEKNGRHTRGRCFIFI